MFNHYYKGNEHKVKRVVILLMCAILQVNFLLCRLAKWSSCSKEVDWLEYRVEFRNMPSRILEYAWVNSRKNCSTLKRNSHQSKTGK